MKTVEIPREIIINNHEAFWQGSYPGDIAFRSGETLWQLAIEQLADHIATLKHQPFDKEIPYNSIQILEAVLASLYKGLNQTQETVNIGLTVNKPYVFNPHPLMQVCLDYRQQWAVRTHLINRPYDSDSGRRRFRFLFHPDTFALDSVKEDRFGTDYWQRLKAPILQASALYLLADLLTDQTWHQPVRVEYPKT